MFFKSIAILELGCVTYFAYQHNLEWTIICTAICIGAICLIIKRI